MDSGAPFGDGLQHGFQWFWHFSRFLPMVSTTAVPGKYQWGGLPLSLSFMSTQHLVTQTNPITVLPLLLKGPQARTYSLLPPHYSPPLKLLKLSRQSECGICQERDFPSTKQGGLRLVPRW